ncbi:tail fiber protein [Komagataeibacter xylinus]|uniref:Tail fiber protein n=1 Tax=Komagataeibacter xylinus TaxID=28448 RepID=A0A857FJ37_KOMXY|nr:tail fiber protein [Komagataeibacter xylinus]QHC34171.1 tail fiber protein [Komagataeibacter xylinus]
MNGFLNLISAAIQPLQAGYLGPFDAAFAAEIGGYPSGAIVSGSTVGVFWVSTADNNTTTPGDDGAAWQSLFNGYASQAWANLQYLRLSYAVTQTVTGPVTFTGDNTHSGAEDFTGSVTIPDATENKNPTTLEQLRSDCPVGTMALWPLTTPPSGWLALNGATFDPTVYPLLAAIFPSGSLPDWSGLFPRGYDPLAINDPDGSTRGIMQFQEATMLLADVDSDIMTPTGMTRERKTQIGWEPPSASTNWSQGGVATTGFGGTWGGAFTGFTRSKNLNCLFIVRAL